MLADVSGCQRCEIEPHRKTPTVVYHIISPFLLKPSFICSLSSEKGSDYYSINTPMKFITTSKVVSKWKSLEYRCWARVVTTIDYFPICVGS
jgi:hypothetical protein